MNRRYNLEELLPKEESEEIKVAVIQIEDDYYSGWFDKCIDPINELLKKPLLDQTLFHLLYRRSNCYWKLCKYEQAEEDLFVVSQMTAERGSREYHRGILTALANLYSDLTQAHKDNPEKKKYYQDLCLEKATFCVKNGADHKHFLHNNIGDILSERKEYAEAIKAYDNAIRVKPDDYWAYRGIANIYTEKQQYKDAVTFFDKAITLAEKKSSSSDVARLKRLEEIEMMKENRKRVSELSITGPKQTLLLKKGEQEEEQKTVSSKEFKCIQSFEFPDLALEVCPKEFKLRINLKEISKNHQFEIIRINDEGNSYIIHSETGLALTTVESLNETNNEVTSKSNSNEKITANETAVLLLEFKESPYQVWRIESEDNGRSRIISTVNEKKLCAVYQNDKKSKFLSKKMKFCEAGRIELQEKPKDGIELWQFGQIKKT